MNVFRFWFEVDEHITHSIVKQKISALITGAGAVENAWDPILKALTPFNDFPLTADGANSYLARLVYLARWFTTSTCENADQYSKEILDSLHSAKSNIIRELKKAEKSHEIRPRPSLEPLVKELLIPYGSTFTLITTNWDTVVSNAIKKILRPDYRLNLRPIHIHGSVAKLSTMYLPSEMTKEPYRKSKDEQAIGRIHGLVWSTLERVQRVIIYGLAIDPLDAELGQTLAAGWSNPNLEEILIVDPNHQIVSHRVNLLLDPRRVVQVKGHNPITLQEEADYTIHRHRSIES